MGSEQFRHRLTEGRYLATKVPQLLRIAVIPSLAFLAMPTGMPGLAVVARVTAVPVHETRTAELVRHRGEGTAARLATVSVPGVAVVSRGTLVAVLPSCHVTTILKKKEI